MFVTLLDLEQLLLMSSSSSLPWLSILLVSLLGWLSTTNYIPKSQNNNNNMATPYSRAKILLLGDSLTQTSFEGWGGALAHHYQRRADVLNRGCSGYNTPWFVNYAKETHVWEEAGQVALVTIFFGANDAALPGQRQYVSVDVYRTKLKEIIQTTQTSYPQAKIVILTPPPIHHAQRLVFQKQRYGDKATGELERTLENTGKYASACRQVAADLGIAAVVDLYASMQEEDADDPWGFGKFLSDGLHFSKEGHDFVFNQLLATIAKHYPTLAVAPCPVTGQPCNSGSSCEGLPTSGTYHDTMEVYKDG